MIGTTFSETENGYTVTGWGRVTKEYIVVEEIEEGIFSCRQTRNDAVMGVTDDYRVRFTIDEINRLKSNSRLP